LHEIRITSFSPKPESGCNGVLWYSHVLQGEMKTDLQTRIALRNTDRFVGSITLHHEAGMRESVSEKFRFDHFVDLRRDAEIVTSDDYLGRHTGCEYQVACGSANRQGCNFLMPDLSFAQDTILLTGARGFIGSAVAKALLKSGGRVRVLLRSGARADDPDCLKSMKTFEGDLLDLDAVKSALEGVSLVYHVAGDYRFWAKDEREIFRNNIDGTTNLVKAAREAGVRRVLCTGTPGVFANSGQGEPADESRVANPASLSGPYKRSKSLAREAALALRAPGFEVLHVHPTAVIGPGDVRPTPTGRILREFAQGRLPLCAATGLSFVDVRDVAFGHLLAMNAGADGADYILGGENLTLRAFLERAAPFLGRKVPRWNCPSWLGELVAWSMEKGVAPFTGREPFAAMEAAHMARELHFFSHERATRELGYQPGTVTSAIAAALDWWKWREQGGAMPAGLPAAEEWRNAAGVQ